MCYLRFAWLLCWSWPRCLSQHEGSQYVYNLNAKTLGVGEYELTITAGGDALTVSFTLN